MKRLLKWCAFACLSAVTCAIFFATPISVALKFSGVDMGGAWVGNTLNLMSDSGGYTREEAQRVGTLVERTPTHEVYRVPHKFGGNSIIAIGIILCVLFGLFVVGFVIRCYSLCFVGSLHLWANMLFGQKNVVSEKMDGFYKENLGFVFSMPFWLLGFCLLLSSKSCNKQPVLDPGTQTYVAAQLLGQFWYVCLLIWVILAIIVFRWRRKLGDRAVELQ
jgi:hypothetical protein